MYRTDFEKIGEQLGAELSQMFGKPCLKSNGKAFAAFFQDCMVFKLGREKMEELHLTYPGSVNFDPSGKGRPMKDWIQISTEHVDSWSKLATQAMEKLHG